jgi:hypothetical protein
VIQKTDSWVPNWIEFGVQVGDLGFRVSDYD